MSLECSEKNNLCSFEKLLVGTDVLLKFKDVESIGSLRRDRGKRSGHL